MPTAIEHGEVVLSAILPDRSDLLDRAHLRLLPEHFIDSNSRKLYELLVRYYETVAKVMTREALSDLLRNRDPSKIILFEELYDSFAERHVDDADFTWSVEQLRDLAAERATQESFTKGMEILRTGISEPGKDRLQGHEDAWEYLMQSRADIEHGLAMQDSPEGNVRVEHNDMWFDYQERKRLREAGISPGVKFGVQGIDEVITGGIQPGEMVMLAGGSSSGKTGACVQLGWSAAVEQGKNVVIFTTETLRDAVRRRIMSRHSKHHIFELPDGINSRDLRDGSLTEFEEEKLAEIIGDLTNNPTYGNLWISQVPRGATVSTLETRMYRIQRMFNIDLVIMDYLALLKPDVRRGTRREEKADTIIEAAQLCKTFDNGRGVPFVSPWQVTRTDQDAAMLSGYYDMNSLAETAEATNSADIAISFLNPVHSDDRYKEVKAQVLKNRDGARQSSIALRMDYATSTITDFANRSQGSRIIMDDDDESTNYLNTLGLG